MERFGGRCPFPAVHRVRGHEYSTHRGDCGGAGPVAALEGVFGSELRAGEETDPLRGPLLPGFVLPLLFIVDSTHVHGYSRKDFGPKSKPEGDRRVICNHA